MCVGLLLRSPLPYPSPGFVRVTLGSVNTTAWVVRPRLGILLRVSTCPSLNEVSWLLPGSSEPWSPKAAELLGSALARRWNDISSGDLIVRSLRGLNATEKYRLRFRALVLGISSELRTSQQVRIESKSWYRSTSRDLRRELWDELVELSRLPRVVVALPTRDPRGAELREIYEDFMKEWMGRRQEYENRWNDAWRVEANSGETPPRSV
mmetsp:Transcript_15457/g.31296  ORF Transcript_15457/g.31296 Transcript_15457/m.31296 type:complete len:209 (-) Transcript_15457:591-1217(-)